jgi:hypothetical protein
LLIAGLRRLGECKRFHSDRNFIGAFGNGLLLLGQDQLRQVSVEDAVYVLFEGLKKFRILKVFHILLYVLKDFVKTVEVAFALRRNLLPGEIGFHLLRLV